MQCIRTKGLLNPAILYFTLNYPIMRIFLIKWHSHKSKEEVGHLVSLANTAMILSHVHNKWNQDQQMKELGKKLLTRFIGWNFCYIKHTYLLILKNIFFKMNIKSCKLVVCASENSSDKNLEQVMSNKIQLSVWPSSFLGATLCSLSLHYQRR